MQRGGEASDIAAGDPKEAGHEQGYGGRQVAAEIDGNGAGTMRLNSYTPARTLCH